VSTSLNINPEIVLNRGHLQDSMVFTRKKRIQNNASNSTLQELMHGLFAYLLTNAMLAIASTLYTLMIIALNNNPTKQQITTEPMA
jgi:predicted nucleic acid-binding protein